MNLPGGSSVFDGMAYLPGLAGTRDTCIFKADGKEGKEFILRSLPWSS